MCTVLTVCNPTDPIQGNREVSTLSALANAPYVTGSFSARVYGINQLPDYQDIPDGSEAAVLVSTQCLDAIQAAKETSGTDGVRLMVRLGMKDSALLHDYHEDMDHGHLPTLSGRKFAYFSLIAPNSNWIEDLVHVVYDMLPYGQEMIRIFREDGGEYLGRTHVSERTVSQLLDLFLGRQSKSEQYLIKSSVENMEEGIADWHRLQKIRGVETVVAFIEE